MGGFEKVLEINPFVNGIVDGYLREKDGVQDIYFTSKDVEGVEANRSYDKVDARDKIFVRAEIDGCLEETSSRDFVSSDAFSRFGSPQQRLALLQKASKYEVDFSRRNAASLQPVDRDLQNFVNGLDPKEKPMAVTPSPLGDGLLRYAHGRFVDAGHSIQETLAPVAEEIQGRFGSSQAPQETWASSLFEGVGQYFRDKSAT